MGKKILTSTFKLKLTLFENSRFRGNENNNGDSEKDKYKILHAKSICHIQVQITENTVK